jgi:hypothetical protein
MVAPEFGAVTPVYTSTFAIIGDVGDAYWKTFGTEDHKTLPGVEL